MKRLNLIGLAALLIAPACLRDEDGGGTVTDNGESRGPESVVVEMMTTPLEKKDTSSPTADVAGLLYFSICIEKIRVANVAEGNETVAVLTTPQRFKIDSNGTSILTHNVVGGSYDEAEIFISGVGCADGEGSLVVTYRDTTISYARDDVLKFIGKVDINPEQASEGTLYFHIRKIVLGLEKAKTESEIEAVLDTITGGLFYRFLQ